MLIKSGLLKLCSPAPQRLLKVKAKPKRQSHLILDWQFCRCTQGLEPARLWAHGKGQSKDGRGVGSEHGAHCPHAEDHGLPQPGVDLPWTYLRVP